MSLSTKLTIIFVSASYSTFIKSCTACPLGLHFAKETCWMHDGCCYHPDMGCLFWRDNALGLLFGQGH
jgi:hypothetical protein